MMFGWLSFARVSACVCLLVLVIAAVPRAGAQSSSSVSLKDAAPVQPPDANDYKLRIAGGDLIEVMVYGVDELKRQVRVSDGGDVTLPLVGVVHLSGASAEQAESLVASAYQKGGYVKDPQVTILIKEFATQGISVLGEVAKPGVYPALGPRRLFDMISSASGMTPKAGRLITITRRGRPENAIQITLQSDLSRSLDSNIEVYPGDTIVVSKAGIVYVVGDVAKPGGFVMDNNEHLTVLQAIALAQGANRTAALKDAKIIRRGPAGMTETPIDLKQIMYAKAADQPMQNDDIVFVPVSAAKSAAKRGMEAILQTATGLAIYRPY
jgi:polysaccharide export outer membrane protein